MAVNIKSFAWGALAASGIYLVKRKNKGLSWWLRTPGMAWNVLRNRQAFQEYRESLAPPRPWRPQWLPSDLRLHSEKDLNPHVPEEKAELFMSVTGGSTETEVLNWLYATICLTKPQNIVETGSYEGLGTIALATACRDNGFGMVHAVEIDADICQVVQRRLDELGLAPYVTVHCQDSMKFLRETDLKFDMGFFDSFNLIRPKEYEICVERGLLTGVAAFHDTSPALRTNQPAFKPGEQEEVHALLHRLAQAPGATGYFESRLSRGFFVIFSSDAPPFS